MPGSLSSVAGHLRWSWLGTCCGLAIGIVAVWFAWGYAVTAMFTDEALTLPSWAGWDAFLVPAVVIVLLVPFQAAAGEYIFRGWFLQAIASCTLETRTGLVGRKLSVVLRTPWPALVISALLFTSAHGYTGWAVLCVFLFGLAAGLLAVKTGGLEAGIVLHTFTNIYVLLLIAAQGKIGSGGQRGEPWQGFLAQAVPVALYAAVVLVIARRRRLQTVTADPARSVPAHLPGSVRA